MSNKISRNELCPCGSGLKYKKCCLNKSIVEKCEAGIELQRNKLIDSTRNMLGDKVKIVNGRQLGAPSMSDIIVDFIGEFLIKKDFEFESRIVEIGIKAWNLALIKSESSRDQEIQYLILDANLDLTKQNKDNLEYFIRLLVSKKLKYYGEIQRAIVNYTLDSFPDGSVKLSVISNEVSNS